MLNIKMTLHSILAFEQKKQLPQGIMKAPTTCEPTGNLKIQTEIHMVRCLIYKHEGKYIYIFNLSIPVYQTFQ